MRTIVKTCYKCNGDGIWTKDTPTGTVVCDPCPVCLGAKVNVISELHLPAGVFESYEILEAIDATEYQGLTDNQKDGVKLVLSCGLVDLNDGKVGKTRLWSWFDSESTTRAALQALLS